MPLYEMTVFKRVEGSPGISQRDLAATFEARDDESAKNDAYRRTKTMPPNHFAVLYDPSHEQLGAWDSPSA